MRYLLIGGAGFIGTNFANQLLSRGDGVIVLDNFSKNGSRLNIQSLLKKNRGNRLKITDVDIRFNVKELENLVTQADTIYHLAAQTAVTTSVNNPREDFETNVLGTFNLLEAVRQKNPKVVLIFSSTNKVYGSLQDIPIKEGDIKYFYKNLKGISESTPLDFYSPYGCSKGAADQYVLDYSRTYSLRTVVFRQSCIYGPYQFGTEDQGWVAWFAIAWLLGKKITIYGNGKQTRDVLYVDDLYEAWDLATKKIDEVKGEVFNIGGGPFNSISLLELVELLHKKFNKRIKISFSNWRVGDQKIFISDNQKLLKNLGWKPKTNFNSGLDKLISWLEENRLTLSSLIS